MGIKRNVLLVLLFLCVCCLMAGCGGGGGGANERGVVTFTVRWPALPAPAAVQPALVPQAARSITIALLCDGQPVVPPQTIVRDGEGPTTVEVTFTEVPAGLVTARATAYPNADGTDVPLATGTVEIQVEGGETVRRTLTMASTVDRLEIDPPDAALAPQQTQQFTATGRNADNEIVLLSAGTLTWTSGDSGVAQVDANGLATAVGPGQTQVTVTDAESGKSAAADVQVTGAGTISGTVTAASPPPPGLGATRQIVPVAGATVTTFVNGSVATATTDAQGNYTVTGLPPGTRAVAFSAPGYVTRTELVVVVDVAIELNVSLQAMGLPSPTQTPAITLNNPVVDEDSGLATISGTISNMDSGTAVLMHNGEDSLVAVTGGAFNHVVVLQTGGNSIALRATNAADTGLSRALLIDFTPGTGDFYFRVTLTWDQGLPANQTDMDLHTWSPQNEHCAYFYRTITCGALDVDNTGGFGPENFTCTSMQAGTFRIAVNFYGGQVPARCVVRVISGARASNTINRLFGPYELSTPNQNGSYPVTGNTASWWRACDVALNDEGRVTARAADTSVNLQGVEGARAPKR